MNTQKPSWWPENPYPESVFPMTTEEYAKAVPDPQLRTAISGCIGRFIWDACSRSIFERMNASARPRRWGGNIEEKCAGLDWTKTDRELAIEHNYSLQWIKHLRLAVSAPTIRNRNPYGRVAQYEKRTDWVLVDWEQSNSMIALAFKVPISFVATKRIELGKPNAKWRANNQKITEEQLQSADWQFTTDMELGRNWGVSRERVRQLRIERGQPCLAKKETTSEHIQAIKWIVEHRSEIEGKHVHDISRMVPSDLPVRKIQCILRRLGINCRWGNNAKWGNNYFNGEIPDFTLPNKYLALVWGVSDHVIATTRSQRKAEKSKWTSGRFAEHSLDPVFESTLNTEIERAKAVGVNNEKVTLEKLNSQKQAVLQRRQNSDNAMTEKMNWDLPNIILTAIWGMRSKNAIANTRCKKVHKKAKWFVSSRATYPINDPELSVAVFSECERAETVGIKVDRAAVFKHLQSKLSSCDTSTASVSPAPATT